MLALVVRKPRSRSQARARVTRPQPVTTPVLSADAARTDHRDRRPGRLAPRRAPARAGLRGVGIVRRPASASYENLEQLRDRIELVQADLLDQLALVRALRATRPHGGLQPRLGLVRARVVGAAGADRRVRRRRRDRAARGDPRRRPGDPLLPGVLERDLRRAGRVAAGRVDAALAAHAVRRREGVRALHHRLVPAALRPARLGRDPLQPRVAAAAARLPAAQGRARRRGDQRSASRASSGSATSTRGATGATPATTCARCG